MLTGVAFARDSWATSSARSDDVPHRWQHQAPRLPERVRISACPVSALCLRMISSSRSSAAVVGSFRELLDHIVVFNDRLLFGLLRDYVAYHHHDRTHLGLDKATPASRPRQTRPVGDAQVIALSRLGDLHHRYEWRAAGRSAPRPPSLRVRHACIDFARHVHRLHLSRIRPSGRRLYNPLEHVRRPDSLRILRRSRHRGAAPASRCEARMRLWRRTRQTEMSGFAQGPNVRAGCLAIPSARPASLAIVSAAPASVFPLRCCPDRQELRFQVATTVSPDSRFWSYCYTRRRLWNWSKSER